MGGLPLELGRGDDDLDAQQLGGVRPRRRSLWALIALALGFWIARAWGSDAPGASVWFAACQGALAISVLVRGSWCRAVLFIAGVLFAGAWFSARFHADAPDRLDRLLASEVAALEAPIVATVRGEALDAPQLSAPRTGVLGRFARTPTSWSFSLRVEAIETAGEAREATGIVRVSVEGGSHPPAVDPGDTLRVTGRFRPIPAPLNPGEPDRRLLALQDSVVGRLVLPSDSLIEALPDRGSGASPSDPPGGWTRLIAWAHQRAAAALDLSNRNDPDGKAGRALLAAMILGSRDAGIEEVDAAFRRVGLVHLVAISGFNLALLAWAAGLVLRLIGDAGRLQSIGIGAIIGLYLLIVPAESPILRAGITVLAFLVAESLGRRYDRITLLGWIACGLLLWRPLDLWSLGFQLSFGIVGALLWLGRRVEDRLFGVPLRGVVSVGVPIGARPGLLEQWWRSGRRVAGGWFKTALSASLLAWGVATPVIIVHTGVLSPWAPLTGLVALPLAGATLCAGYAALVVGFVWPGAGAAVASVATWAADLLAGLVLNLDGVPGATLQLPRVSALWGAAAAGVVLYWFARGRRRSILAWALAALAAAWLAVEVYSSTRLPSRVAMRVDTLAVGDGTCHLIRAGDEAMLWDCGSSHPGLGLRELPRAVRALGASSVRSALVTHANLDHFLCLPDVIAPLGIQRVYVTRAFLDETVEHPGSAAAALIRELESHSVTVLELAAGSTLNLGPVRCEILNPDAGAPYTEANDTSLVGLFHAPTAAGERRVLMTGDIGPGAIARVLAEHPSLDVDVLELPHHGSARPESMAFTQGVDPAIVLQSTGPQRVGDRRWDAVKPGRQWYVTALDGAAWIEIGRDGTVQSGALRTGAGTPVIER